MSATNAKVIEINPATLCAAWLKAKAEEQQAKDARYAIEQQLVDLLEFSKPEGSKTFTLDGFKVECKGSISYSLDAKKWAEIQDQIPDGMRPVKVKLEADPTGCKFLRSNEPDLWKIAAQAITAKPAKVGVSITPVEGK